MAAEGATGFCFSFLLLIPSIALFSCEIYYGTAAFDKCPVEPRIPMWLQGE